MFKKQININIVEQFKLNNLTYTKNVWYNLNPLQVLSMSYN